MDRESGTKWNGAELVQASRFPAKKTLYLRVASGKRLHIYGKSPCLMGKSTRSMAIFNSYVSLPEGTCHGNYAGNRNGIDCADDCFCSTMSLCG